MRLRALALVLAASATCASRRAGADPEATRAAPLPGAGARAGDAARLAAVLEASRDVDRPGARDVLRSACDEAWTLQDLGCLEHAEASLRAGEPGVALAVLDQPPWSGGLEPSRRSERRAAWLRVRALEGLGRHVERAAACASIAARDGDDAGAARACRAESLQLAGRSADAAAAWREAWLASPADAPEDALERARRLASGAGAPLREPTLAELTARAERLARGHRHASAERAWEGVAARTAGAARAAALLERARALHALRRNEEARATCGTLADDHPSARDAVAQCRLVSARAAWRVGDGEAVDALTRQGLADPASRPLRSSLATLRAAWLAEAGRIDEAERAWRDLAAGAGPQDAFDATWRLAWLHVRLGRHAEAASVLARLAAGTRDEDDRRAARLWSAVFRERADPARDATAAIVDVAREDPWSWTGLAARGMAAARLDPAALASLDEARSRWGVPFVDPGPPSLPGLHGSRYALLRDAGLHADALAEIEALPRPPRDPAAAALDLERARARARAGDLGGAAAIARRRLGAAWSQPSRAVVPGVWGISHPVGHREALHAAAELAGVEPALLAAIARSESSWDAEARSPAGAVGLVQLMPATAAALASQLGLPPPDDAALRDPATALRLGASYLGQLVDLFDGDLVAAVAAYNAGEDRVAAWWADMDDRGVPPGPERVELIPYRETRTYVGRVLAAADAYRWLTPCEAP